MEVKDYITIIAVLLSPVIAVQVEKLIERNRNKKNRKINIFKTLMATRGTRLSIEHVTALNQIDLEFYGEKKYKKVLEAWKEYFDQLNAPYNPDQYMAWSDRAEELFTNMLYEMGIQLNLNFDKVTIRRNMYSPTGHAKIEAQHDEIRNLLIKILKGENAITTLQTSPDEIAKLNVEAINKTGELQSLLMDYYKTPKIVKVKIINDVDNKE